MASALYPRRLRPRLDEALADTPVVLLNGPRQSGKTTLVQQLADKAGRRYLTLDDPATLLSAQDDPVGLVRGLDRAVIDEVQRAPGLLLAIKRAVDQDRRPGRFLLTGSANVMMLPGVADSLAGRMETLALLPLAGCEIHGGKGRWLDALFSGTPPSIARSKRKALGESLARTVLCGGYPEAVGRTTPRRRAAWARQYVEALIQRDVREIANVEKLDHLPRLLRALAQMAGQLCNFAQLAGQVGLDSKTAGKYLAVFEQIFLLRRVAPWSVNRLGRIVKTPKIHFLDSGLLCSLSGLTEASLAHERGRFGHALESYVFGELLKLASWAEGEYELFTYRDKDQIEVDFVVEDRGGRVAGVEVKAAASVSRDDFAGLRRLATLAGRKFAGGVVLYDGTETLPVGDGLWAVPVSTLWLG